MTTAAAPESQADLIQPDSDADVLKKIHEAISANTSPTDIRFSRLAMMQPQSPEITKQVPGYRQGQIIDNVTREILSVEELPPWLLEKGVKKEELKPIHFCLVALNFKLPTEYIKWIPKTEQQPGGDRWEFKTLDAKDERVTKGIWVSQGGTFMGKKPPVTINGNYLLSVIDSQLKIMNGYFRVATFCRTSATCGQTVAQILQSHRMQNIKPWDRCYYLYTVRHDNPQPHYVYQFARGPLLKDVAEPYVAAQCLEMGRSLVGPNGPLFQSIIISAATLGEEDATREDGDVSSGNQQSASEDPFAAPAEGAGGAGSPASF